MPNLRLESTKRPAARDAGVVGSIPAGQGSCLSDRYVRVHFRFRQLAAIRDRTENRTVGASSNGDALLACLLIVGGLVVAYLATYAAGGTKTALPHAFYVPVIVAAVRFHGRGAFVVAIAAGVTAGPLMPLDVATGSRQDTINWLTRLLTFVLIGQLTAYLSRHSLPPLSAEISARRFRQELRDAITNGRIRLEYQPIVRLSTGELAGVEVLARWDHPTRGPVSPAEFVPRAESAGCISELSRFVLDTASEQVAAWRETVLAGRDSFVVAVNISGAELLDHAILTRHVTEVLERTGVPNGWLHLEITETALVEDVDQAINGLMALRMLGVRLAIDDFGTGESSLSYLDQFPVDVLKIDRRFVHRLEHNNQNDALTKGVVALAHAMRFATVAEGVETTMQARAIRDYDCDLAQGYLFSRPLPPHEFHELLVDPDTFCSINLTHLVARKPEATSARARTP